MYKCPTCKHTFESPLVTDEPHGETTTSCPDCYDGGYEEVEPCQECGEYVPVREWMRQDGLCTTCYVDKDKEMANEPNNV